MSKNMTHSRYGVVLMMNNLAIDAQLAIYNGIIKLWQILAVMLTIDTV